MSVLVPDLDDLGSVRETLIFKTWNLLDLIGYKDISLQVELPMYSFSENSGGKLLEQEALVFKFLLQKCLILFLQYL